MHFPTPFLLLAVSSVAPAAAAAVVVVPSAPTVDVGYTKYIGTKIPNGVSQFLGIRYAAAPLSSLRWRPPQPPPTSPPQNATSFSPICVGESQQASASLSEDCLFLNVWSPPASNSSSSSSSGGSSSSGSKSYSSGSKKLKPVWFFIQGGGYVVNSNPNYNGSLLAANNDVVFVNFNYRVGALGFLASPDPEIMKSEELNLGFQDQIAALEWVQKHISKFGGDPNQVVMHGVSAGAGSISLHMMHAYTHPRAKPLFHGGILTSPFWPTQPKLSTLGWQFSRFANASGCAVNSHTLDCLRTKPIATLQAANVRSPYPGRTTASRFYWTPTVEGNWVSSTPYKAFREGKFVAIPIVVGDETDEGTYFTPTPIDTATDMVSFMGDNYPKLSATNAEKMVALYEGTQSPLNVTIAGAGGWWPAAALAYGEMTFNCVGDFISTAVQRKGKGEVGVWNYYCAVRDESNTVAGRGVPHTWCDTAIVGVENGGVGTEWETKNRGLLGVLGGGVGGFVKTLRIGGLGDEEGAGKRWGQWGRKGGERLRVELGAVGMEKVDGGEAERCAFWAGIGEELEQ